MIEISSRKKTAILVLLAALLLAAYVLATYGVFTSRFPGANDFYSRWKGTEVYWREGINPYSEEATLAIQQGVYGHPAEPDEDPGPFAYPFYTVFLLAPIAWLPYTWAQAIWLVVLQVSLGLDVALCLSLLDWRLPPWLLALTALWSVFFYHSARTIFLSQFAGLVFLCTVGARNLVLPLFYLLSAVGIWLLFLVTVVDRFEHPIVYLPLSVALFGALYGPDLPCTRAQGPEKGARCEEEANAFGSFWALSPEQRLTPPFFSRELPMVL